MQNISIDNVAESFIRKMDLGLSERRLREEIGKLSCDELAAVLVKWQRSQTEPRRSVE